MIKYIKQLETEIKDYGIKSQKKRKQIKENPNNSVLKTQLIVYRQRIDFLRGKLEMIKDFLKYIKEKKKNYIEMYKNKYDISNEGDEYDRGYYNGVFQILDEIKLKYLKNEK